MPSIFPKRDKEGKQLASAKDEQTLLERVFWSMKFQLLSAQWQLECLFKWHQSYMVWTNPLGCNTKKKAGSKNGFNI